MNLTNAIRGAAGRISAGLASTPPPGLPDAWAGNGTGAGMRLTAGSVSFGRIVAVPFGAWVAALDRWQLTVPGGQLRLGPSLVRGPVERDRDLGTWRIEVCLGRGPLRPPVRMRLDIDRLSATSTALQLIPCQRVRPTAAYFRAGHHLLDTLTSALLQPAAVPVQPARHERDIWRHRQPAPLPAP
jgi:hypothetical protein